jgi:hypothetical protein
VPTYLIEVRHESGGEACVRALHALDQSGSHFVTHADFGCADGAHCGWLTVEVESRKIAEQIVPPEFRSAVRIVELRKFTREEIHRMMKQYEA